MSSVSIVSAKLTLFLFLSTITQLFREKRCDSIVRCYGFQDLLNKARLGDCAQDFDAIVDHGFGDALHLVALRKVDELGDFNDIGGDMLVFDCQLVGQPGHARTIGSGRGDEHLDMHILIDCCQRLTSFFAQICCPFRDIDEVLN